MKILIALILMPFIVLALVTILAVFSGFFNVNLALDPWAITAWQGLSFHGGYINLPAFVSFIYFTFNWFLLLIAYKISMLAASLLVGHSVELNMTNGRR